MFDTAEEKAKFFQLANKYLETQISRARWKRIFKFAIISIILLIFIMGLFSKDDKSAIYRKSHIAMIDINGAIAEDQKANADAFATSFKKIEKSTGAKAVLIRISSPGGSPVQASYMYNIIKKFRQKHPKMKVYSVCAEACASAAYYIASATENIYADKSSIVGSIGVIYRGFGFVDTMQKLGVERRLITAGKNKGFMDPFTPLTTEQKEKFEKILKIVHQEFKQKVIDGRGKRLKLSDDLFSGIFWTGSQALDLGLIDGFASPGEVARDILKEEKIVNYSKKDNYFEELAKRFGDHLGASIQYALNSAFFHLH